MRMNGRGQIGPMSLEDFFPMVIAFIMTFVLIATVYIITAGHLEQRGIESAHKIARETAQLIRTNGLLVYGIRPALLDADRISKATYEELNDTYGTIGYSFSVQIEDLVTGTAWDYEPGGTDQNTASATIPIAIRYSNDTVHEGILSVWVWRK